ncbi:ribonuclease J [Spiroplasma endosymbiont of Amphibalanus improvisus]|uniref:ribonuclease J n=1 Tax=Spiroplasma endosymbiont of Amphibalanus improvisus TaxID=3066327 RepID=UPI00313CC8A1
MNNNVSINKKIVDGILTKPNENSMSVYALGGLEEIGKNTYCIENKDDILILDAGVKFPSKDMLGVDAIIPNYQHLVENSKKIKALCITHGHEDHIGGIPYLLRQVKIPVIYAPPLAASLIKDRLKEFKLTKETNVVEVASGKDYLIGKNRVSFFRVNHSIPDAFGIAVHTENGLIVSTGDYKFDWTPLGHRADIERMTSLGNEGVTLLMADSTNAEVEGYTETESNIIKNIDEIFLKAKGRIFISTFASNVHRIQKIIEMADKHKRKILVFGRSLERIIKIIRQIGHLKIKDNAFVKTSDISKFKNKDHELLIICTGSQGEPMAALSRIARGEHKVLNVKKGDSVIFSSSPIPGNKLPIEIIVNKLIRSGAYVFENDTNKRIHTSGHASQEEQKLLFNLLKPKYFMPMHGDYRMLKKHGETAVEVNVEKDNVFICANGNQINIYKEEAVLGKSIDAEPIYVDGKDLSGKTTSVVRDREVLSRDGLITVLILIDSKENKLLSDPVILSRGSFYVKGSGSIIGESISLVKKAVTENLNSEHVTFNSLKNCIKQSLKPFIYKIKKRNPLIIPVILNKN